MQLGAEADLTARPIVDTFIHERVAGEWGRRVGAEYGSAAVTQHFTLWLIQIGASPDLIDRGLRIVADELVHARLSHDVVLAAGGPDMGSPVLDRSALALPFDESRSLESNVLHAAVRVFCINETLAVPLFKNLRSRCTEASACLALDRVMRDEPRHRSFGWLMLDWALDVGLAPDVVGEVEMALPGLLSAVISAYGQVDPEAATVTSVERSWGLAPPIEYARILIEAMEGTFVIRFGERGIDVATPWRAAVKAAGLERSAIIEDSS